MVTELLNRGAEVKCLARAGSRTDHLRRDGVELVEGSLSEADVLRDAVASCDAVIHLAGLVAAHRREQLFEVNSQGCRLLGEACAAAGTPPRLVYVSSVAAGGPPPAGKLLRDETDEPQPVSNYGRSKLQGEVELQKMAGEVPITVVRPGVVFGPGDRAGLKMFRAIRRSRTHVVVGRHSPPLSVIYVNDAVGLILEAASRGETLAAADNGDGSRGCYYACDDSLHPSYKEFGQRIAAAMDVRVLICPVFRWAGFAIGAVSQTAAYLRGRPSILNVDKIRESLAHSWACASTKARRELDFTTSDSLDDQLRRTAQWYREHGWL